MRYFRLNWRLSRLGANSCDGHHVFAVSPEPASTKHRQSSGERKWPQPLKGQGQLAERHRFPLYIQRYEHTVISLLQGALAILCQTFAL
jgi:hypothetical protein